MKYTPVIALMLAAVDLAHDTWLQTNANLVRVGEVVHIDLLLGNHGESSYSATIGLYVPAICPCCGE